MAPWKIVKNIFWKWIKKKTITKKIPVLKSKKLVQKTGLSKKEKLLKKNVKLNISFQKKNLKISWKTFPNSKVEIKIWEQSFYKTSLSNWKYIFKINNNLVAWKYKILVSVYDQKWILIAQKKSREKNITQEYIAQLNKYKYKKYLTSIKKKKKRYKKYKRKIKKFKLENNNLASIIPINKKNFFDFKIFAINILIAILCFILINLSLVKRKII